MRIGELICLVKDWNAFIDLAYEHGVFPLVYKTLKNYGELIPQEILHSIKMLNIEIVKENMLMTAELIKVMKLLEKNNIEALAFKGPTLAQMAYGNITLRQYSDLDIFVHKKDIYKIYDLLKDTYSRSLKLTTSQEPTWFKYAHDLGLTSPNGTHIEFHWTMLDTDHPVNLEKINFFHHKASIAINKTQVNVMSNEIFLVYLCIHGSKHMFERIEWIVDIDQFVRTQNIDWDLVFQLSQNKNYKYFVNLGFYLAKQLFNSPIKVPEYKNFEIIEKHIYSSWNDIETFDNKTNLEYMLLLFTSKVDKLKYLHKIYLKPTFSEYWFVDLPKPLYFLYYPLRQCLLIYKYFLKRFI